MLSHYKKRLLKVYRKKDELAIRILKLIDDNDLLNKEIYELIGIIDHESKTFDVYDWIAKKKFRYSDKLYELTNGVL